MYNGCQKREPGGGDPVIHVAIVEDAAFDRKILRDCLAQYTAETGEAFDTTEYSSGEDFLSRCSGEPELIFMDIVMEELDGLSTARRLRLKNEKSLLIFVTSMLQYAVQGYSVDAMDFLVKPVSYPIFKLCLDRAVKKLRQDSPQRLSFSNREGSWSVPASEIFYIESLDHKIYVHTADRVLPVDGSLAAVEAMVAALPFFRCHVSYLVNLAYVERVSGNDVWVHGERLAISRYRRREFLDAWSAWLG